jgi:hypothetical protein
MPATIAHALICDKAVKVLQDGREGNLAAAAGPDLSLA